MKEQLMHEIIRPFKDTELHRLYRVSLPNGILFYGPPGCGKTSKEFDAEFEMDSAAA